MRTVLLLLLLYPATVNAVPSGRDRHQQQAVVDNYRWWKRLDEYNRRVWCEAMERLRKADKHIAELRRKNKIPYLKGWGNPRY